MSSIQKKIKRLGLGHVVQFNHGELKHLSNSILSNENMKKVKKALDCGKGCRIQFTSEEIDGNGIGKAFNKLKNTKNLGAKVSNISNKIAKGIHRGAMIAEVVAPEFTPAIAVADRLATAGNAATQASIKATRKGAKIEDQIHAINQIKSVKDQTVNEAKNLIGKGVNPYLPKALQGGSCKPIKGGSFKAMGKGFKAGGGALSIKGGAPDQLIKHTHGKLHNDNSSKIHPDAPAFTAFPPKTLHELMTGK